MSSAKYERVMTAIARGIPDRVPWGLWGHFASLQFLDGFSWERASKDGEHLAKSHIALLEKLDYEMDILKVTPFFPFMSIQWGSKFKFVGNDENAPQMDAAVKETSDWSNLWVLDPKKELKEHLRAVSTISREIGRETPFVYTVPSPFVQALHHVATPDRVYADMAAQPDALKQGLETITQTCIDFARECVAQGATGIYYAIGGGGNLWSRMNREQLKEYTLNYDLRVLDSIRDVPITLLHICSTTEENPQLNGRLMEEGWFKQYPVKAINWWDSGFTPVAAGKRIYGDKFCVVTGIDQRSVMTRGKPREIERQVRRAIEGAASGGGFILGPGCTLFQETSLANFNAVGRAAERYGTY